MEESANYIVGHFEHPPHTIQNGTTSLHQIAMSASQPPEFNSGYLQNINVISVKLIYHDHSEKQILDDQQK